MSDGKLLSESVTNYLGINLKNKKKKDFNCRFGGLKTGDMEVFMTEASNHNRNEKCLTENEAINEATRCLHCDCRKTDNCQLREYSNTYNAKQHEFKSKTRCEFRKITEHNELIYEPGKCIKCGICTRISANHSDELGLAFSGRGFETTIAVPFMETFDKGLIKATAECIENCPTGALAWK